MTPLHIVSKSPFAHSALADCLRACGDNAAIVLIEDGVNAALAGSEWAAKLNGHRVFVLMADLDARALRPRVDPTFAVVDYPGFVQLCCDHSPIVSWY